jgi:hypothetical protein
MKQILSFILIISLFSCEKGNADSNAFANPTGQGGSLARFTIAGNFYIQWTRKI